LFVVSFRFTWAGCTPRNIGVLVDTIYSKEQTYQVKWQSENGEEAPPFLDQVVLVLGHYVLPQFHVDFFFLIAIIT
jgi:hypothetical protein